jgi:hypothetical protein
LEQGQFPAADADANANDFALMLHANAVLR